MSSALIAAAPRSANWAALFGLVGVVAIAVGGVLMAVFKGTLDEQFAEDGLKSLIFSLIPFAACLIGLANANSYNKKRWPRLMETWRRYFVCLKCSCVWIPDQSNQGP